MLVAALTLALGIGANVSVYALIDAVLFRPITEDEPDRLVRLASVTRATESTRFAFSYPACRPDRGRRAQQPIPLWRPHSGCTDAPGGSRVAHCRRAVRELAAGASRGADESRQRVTGFLGSSVSSHSAMRSRVQEWSSLRCTRRAERTRCFLHPS